MRQFAHSLSIAAPPAAVLDAFFDHDALTAWWQVTRSLCTPRMLGSYAVEWPTSDGADDVLGRGGGVFRGTVVDFTPGKEFFVADAYWLPPDTEPIGPMAFEVSCTPLGERTVVNVRQSGGGDSRRWGRYYEMIGGSLPPALEELKRLLEADGVRKQRT